MKHIIKRTALPVLGLASLGAITQAQADTEPYPAQLQSLIDEAKSLGIQVVEVPNKDYRTPTDLQTYYDNIAVKLQGLVTEAKTLKQNNDRQEKLYQDALRQYEDAMKRYQEAQAQAKEKEAQFQKDSKEYEATQASNAKLVADYQAKLAEWKQKSAADKAAQAQYEKDLAAYNQALEAQKNAQAKYEKDKATYDKAQTQFEADTTKYNTDKAAYEKAMSDYNAKKAEYDRQLAQYQAQKQAYDAAVAKWEAGKNTPGTLSQPESQGLIFNREPQARPTVSGQGTYFQVNGGEVSGAMPIVGSSIAGNKAVNKPTFQTAQWADALSPARVGAGQESDTSIRKVTAIGLYKGQTATIRYDNLQNSSIDGRKVSSVKYDYTLLESPSDDESIVGVFYTDPTETIYFGTVRQPGNLKDIKLKLKVTFYYEDGTPVDLSKTNALFSFASLNRSETPQQEQEYVGVIDAFKPILINGSSIVYQDGKLGAIKDNDSRERGSQFNRGEWDTAASSPNAYWGAAAGKATKPSMELIIGNHPTGTSPRAGARQWFQLNSSLKATGLLPAKPVEPVEPVKPNTPKPQTPDANPNPKPEVPKATPLEKPKQPQPSAGPEPKAPKTNDIPKPKDPTDNAVTPPVKPNPPKPATATGRIEIARGSVLQKTTRWVTTDGKELKKPVTADEFKPKESFPNYEFVETKVDGNITTHIYKEKPEAPKPVEKPKRTTWVDEQGNKLKDPKDGEHPDNEGDDVPGYTLVRIDKDKDGNVINVYRKNPEKPVEKPKRTTWVDEKGNQLKDPKDGEHPDNEGDDVPGYTLVRINKDKDGNVTNIYRKTPEKPVEKPKKTTWVDENGNKLKDPKDGEHPDKEGDDVPGYTLVRIDKDKDGNVINVYRKNPEKPVEKPKRTTWVDEKGNKLKDPEDGEHPDKEGDDVPGYTLVRIDKDKDGNITNIYRKTPEKPVEKPKKTTWVDEQGNKLKDPEDGEHPDTEGDDVPGYKLLHIKKDADGNIVNVYQKIPEKPKRTTWVDEHGNKLKDPEDGEHPDTEGDDVPGYRLVRVDKDKDGNITNVYEKIKKTTWVDEHGNQLKDPQDGEHPDTEGDDVPGYKLVRVDKDKDGNITNVYEKIKKTTWVDEQGNQLKDPQDGEHPDNEGDDVPGYQLVRVDKDKDGNITNVYKKIETPQPQAKELPKTGDVSALTALLGLASLLGGAGLTPRKKRDE